jgi:hypothetical protein
MVAACDTCTPHLHDLMLGVALSPPFDRMLIMRLGHIRCNYSPLGDLVYTDVPSCTGTAASRSITFGISQTERGAYNDFFLKAKGAVLEIPPIGLRSHFLHQSAGCEMLVGRTY